MRYVSLTADFGTSCAKRILGVETTKLEGELASGIPNHTFVVEHCRQLDEPVLTLKSHETHFDRKIDTLYILTTQKPESLFTFPCKFLLPNRQKVSKYPSGNGSNNTNYDTENCHIRFQAQQ